MRQFLQLVISLATIACISLSTWMPAGAWQRPKVGEDLPPLRKSDSGEPQLLSPPLGAAPATATAEEPEDDAPLPLPPASPPAAPISPSPIPAESHRDQPRSSISLIGEGDAKSGGESLPLRSIATSTLAQTASFRGVTPGKTGRSELVELWGNPVSETPRGEQTELSYAIPPFTTIDVIVQKEIVASLICRYETTVSVETAAETLSVARFTPAAIRDERGKVLGQVYPERGVLLGMADSKVSQVVIEPPTAEAFLTRAEQQRLHNAQASLADIKLALDLEPKNERGQKLLIKVLLAEDRVSEALSAAKLILQEAPENIQARLMSARAALLLARWRETEREARSILEQKDLSQIDRAAASLLLGDVLARSPQRDVRGAMKHHYQAAEAATLAVQESGAGPNRQEALETAVDAYLAIAEDLARGHWRRREETFAQWIAHAELVVETLAGAEIKDEWLFHVRRRAVEASAAAGGAIEPAPYAAAALEMGSRLVAASSDPIRRAELQAVLGASLLESSQSLMTAGKHAAGRNYIFDAQRLLESARQQNATPRTEHLLGRAYFFRGLDQAVGEKDHVAATEWYAKAMPLLDRPLPDGRLSEAGPRGQQLVTMAVSLWEADQRQQAVGLTEKGLGYIQEAVDRAELERTALAAPLSNLANMNRILGNDEQAEKYQTRLVDFQTPAEELPQK